MEPTTLEKFRGLFAGRTDAFGQYPPPKRELPGEKRLADGRHTSTRGVEGHRELDLDHWRAHLEAKMGLGIVPVRTDGTVQFFVFDVDKYDVDDMHTKLVKRIDRAGLPLVLTRSKSGGAHIWCFLTEPMDAGSAIELMKEWKLKLGFAAKDKKVELFPKQASVKSMDVGSWINLPYFGGDMPFDGRVGVGPRGNTLTIDEFVRLAEARRISPAELHRCGEDEEPAVLVEGSAPLEHQQAPPCIQRMLVEGVPEGGRNNCLYQMAVYLVRSQPDTWKETLFGWNAEHMNPPLPYAEVTKTVASLSRNPGQRYKGCDGTEQPMASMCDMAKCKLMLHGIGGGTGSAPKDLVRKVYKTQTDAGETYFIFKLNDNAQFSMTGAELYKMHVFKAKWTGLCGRMLRLPKKFDWVDFIDELIADAHECDADEKAFQPGEIVVDVYEDWLHQNPPSPHSDFDRDVLSGKPVYVHDEKAVYFRASALLAKLKRSAHLQLSDDQLWPILNRKLGAQALRKKIGNQAQCRVIRVPCETPWFEHDELGLDDGEDF